MHREGQKPMDELKDHEKEIIRRAVKSLQTQMRRVRQEKSPSGAVTARRGHISSLKGKTDGIPKYSTTPQESHVGMAGR